MSSLSAIAAVADPIARRETSVVETVEAALERAQAAAGLDAFFELDSDGARARARDLDRELEGGALP